MRCLKHCVRVWRPRRHTSTKPFLECPPTPSGIYGTNCRPIKQFCAWMEASSLVCLWSMYPRHWILNHKVLLGKREQIDISGKNFDFVYYNKVVFWSQTEIWWSPVQLYWISIDGMTAYLRKYGGIDRFQSRGQKLCKLLGIKESLNMWKEFNSHRIFLVHKHGRRFILLYTNMAAVTSCENALYSSSIILWIFFRHPKFLSRNGTFLQFNWRYLTSYHHSLDAFS